MHPASSQHAGSLYAPSTFSRSTFDAAAWLNSALSAAGGGGGAAPATSSGEGYAALEGSLSAVIARLQLLWLQH